jgi:oligosaccharide repeat unit polymerase
MVQKNNNNWLVMLIQSYIAFGLLIFGLIYAANPSGFMLTADTTYQVMCQLFLGLVVWSFVSWYLLTKRLFDPYVLFLISAIIFNGGQIILEVFHLNEKGFLGNAFSVAESLQIVYIVTLAICAMHFGAILGVVLDRSKSDSSQFLDFLNRSTATDPYVRLGLEPTTDSPSQLFSTAGTSRLSSTQKPRTLFRSSLVPASTALMVGQILLYFSIIPVMVITIGALQVAKAGGYGSLYEQQAVTGAAASVQIIADFMFPGVFLTIAGAQRKPHLRIFAVLCILFYTCAKLTIGTRGAAVMPLLAMLWLWDGVVRPIPKSLLVGVSALLGLVILPLVGATRNEVAGVDIFSIDFITKTLTSVDNPLVASISEMGFSATTIGWTMDLVPKVRPFAAGMTYLVGMLILIPNVFSSGRHPALTMSGYDIPDFWLVAEIDKDFAQRGGSFGFSFISEAYLNFGWFGIVFMVLLGFAFAKLVQWALRERDPIKMAIIAIFVSFFLFYPRGSSEMVFRPFIWYSLVPYLWMRWLSKLNPIRIKGLLKALRKGEK